MTSDPNRLGPRDGDAQTGSGLNPSPVVFIVSQPRAGSTLLQTMLAGHPDLTSSGEAWLMLPLAHAIGGSRRDVKSPYDACLADDATGEFVREHLGQDWGLVQRAIGSAAQQIYDAARGRAGARVLIDKTPRYYWIIEDLLAMLPQARVIVLRRNPLAVLSSIVQTWVRRKRVGYLSPFRADLLEAPARLAAAMALEHERIITLRYEDLVADPETELFALQRFIGVRPRGGLAHYGHAKPSTYGDPCGIHRHQSAQSESTEKYVELAAGDATLWRVLDDYRIALGDDLLSRLGYDGHELRDQLASVQPPGTRIAPSLTAQVSPRPAEPIRSWLRLRRVTAESIARLGRAA